MKLTVNDVLVNPVLGRAVLEKHRGDAAATLTATIWTAAADAYFLRLSLAVGDVVRLYDDDGTERFAGSIHRIDRTPEQAVITAFDKGIYLARNQLWGVFIGTGEEICRTVAEKLQIDVDSIDADETFKTITAVTGQNAFSVLRTAAGADREITVEEERLVVRKSRDTVFVLPTEQILEVSAAADIRDMVNRCTVVDYKGSPLSIVHNAGDILQYGMFHCVQERRDIDTAGQAAAALQGRRRTAETVLLGNLGYCCGAKVQGRQPEWGLEGMYCISAVFHRWENGLFTTELTLEGEDDA